MSAPGVAGHATSANAAPLERGLGFFDSLALVVGVTIGAGIFAVPGRVAQYFSSFEGIAAAWLIASLYAFAGSFIYAELGSRLPYTGGEYVYIHRAFGALPAFLYGWAQLLAIRTYPLAALTLVFAEYTETFVKLGEHGRLAVAALIIVLLGLINYFGLRSGKTVQAVTTILKVGGILAFIVWGVFVVRDYGTNLASTHIVPSALGPIGRFSSAMLLTIFTYIGWDRVGYLGGEIRNPERTLPRVLMLGAAIVAFLYLSMNFFYHASMPISAISGSRVPAADFARLLWGAAGAYILAVIVMISTSGAQNGNVMASSRVYYAMASDGLFLASFARVHPRWRSPYVAIIAQCGWAIVLLLAGRSVETLAGSYVFSLLILWSVVTLAYFKFRRGGMASGPASAAAVATPLNTTPYLAPGYPWMPALYLVGLAAMAVATLYFHPVPSISNLALMSSGLPLYYFWKKRAARR